MEPIFGNGTLKSDEAAFKRIDKDFRYIMKEIANDPRLLSVTKINNISTIIDALENQLSRCQNTLTSYISVSLEVLKAKPFQSFLLRANEMHSPGSISLPMMIYLKFLDKLLKLK